MITGVHAIVYSQQADAVRAFFHEVVGLPSVDAGAGWAIFRLPPAELAVHPHGSSGVQELYLMCDDIDATLDELRAKGVEIAREPTQEGWGRLAALRLPDGSELPIYEPSHASPPV